MRVPNDILQPALKLLQRVAHISTSLTVPIDHTYLRSKKYNHATLSNTAFLTPEGVILLSKKGGGGTVPVPSHPDAASGPSQHADFLPFSWACCDVLQSVLVSMCAHKPPELDPREPGGIHRLCDGFLRQCHHPPKDVLHVGWRQWPASCPLRALQV
jgi:hypothetical protein